MRVASLAEEDRCEPLRAHVPGRHTGRCDQGRPGEGTMEEKTWAAAAYAVIVIDEVRTGFTEAAAAQDCYLGATARKHAQQI